MNKSVQLVSLVVLTSLLTAAPRVFAASYYPISDQDLVDRTPVVVRAAPVQSLVVAIGGPRTETRTTFSVEEVAHGSADKSIEVALPGGTLPSGAGSYAWMPEFRNGHDYVLFLYRRPDGIYGVSELELGVFEIQFDSTGAAFAIRPRLESLAAHPLALPPRELRSFLAMAAGIRGLPPAKPPTGPLAPSPITAIGGTIRPMWNNLGSTLSRWNNGASVSVGYVDDDSSDELGGGIGPQAHVEGGGLLELQNAVSHWDNDSSSDISLSLVGIGPKTITIHTDDTAQFGGSGIPCSLGVVGLTSVSWSSPNQTYKGETYRTLLGADVYLRRWDCATNGYLSSAFENVATHELGHALGLDHPDQGTSPHDNTANDVSGAVMISVGNYNRPTGLGSDDIEGICWLYGSCASVVSPPPPPPPPSPPSPSTLCQVDTYTLCFQGGRFRARVSWQALHLGTSGKGVAVPIAGDTGAFWFFNSGNLELVVKVLDGRSINGHFWVFYGALSNVQYTITVTDTQTGSVRTYTNPQDTLASQADTAAF